MTTTRTSSSHLPEGSTPGAGAGGGLIAASPDGSALAGLPRGVVIGVVTLFLVVCAGTGLVDLLLPLPPPALRGGEQRIDLQRRSEASWTDGSRARLVEYDMRLTSLVRRTLSGPYGLLLYKLLREAGPDVVVGEDDWLFLRKRLEAEPGAERRIQRAALELGAATRRLAGYRVQLLALPVPRKGVAASDHLPRGVDPHPEYERSFVEQLRALGVPTVDLLPLLLESEGDTFFACDSHWNEEAERIAALALAEAAGMLVPEEERKTALVQGEPEPTERKTFYFLGIDPDSPLLSFADRHTSPDWQLRYRRGREFRNIPVAGLSSPVAVVGTSFSARRELPVFLAHHINEPVANLAEAGGHPLERLEVLLGMLGSAADADPLTEPRLRVAVVEFPLHMLLEPPPALDVGGLFSAAPPAFTLVVDRLGDGSPLAEPRPDGTVLVASRSAGRIAHSGTGALGVELRGKALEEDVEVELELEEESIFVRWPKGATRIVQPLLLEAQGAPQLRVIAPPAEELELEAIELVSEVDPELRRGLVVSEPEQGPAGWSQSFTSLREIVVPHGGVLLVDVRPGEELVCGLRVVTETGLERALDPLPVLHGARLALDLQGLAGETLTEVQAFGPAVDALPPQIARTVDLHGLPEPR